MSIVHHTSTQRAPYDACKTGRCIGTNCSILSQTVEGEQRGPCMLQRPSQVELAAAEVHNVEVAESNYTSSHGSLPDLFKRIFCGQTAELFTRSRTKTLYLGPPF